MNAITKAKSLQQESHQRTEEAAKAKRALWNRIKTEEPELAGFIAAFPGTRILSHKVGDDYLIDSPEGKAHRASEAKQEVRAAKDAEIERNHFRLVQAQSILRREK